MEAIKIENLNFGYTNEELVLKNLSLSINQGEYTTLVGHNGSGKSTLAKLFIGLLEPKSGSVKVFDRFLNLENLDWIRGKIGIVFQNPDNQFIGSTVEDDIAFGLENHCVPSSDMQDIINEYAGKVNMLDYLKSEPNKLSGGQKQRVAIAGVLAMHPDIIIFDEATSMLDPKGKKEINDVIGQLKQEKKLTIVSITHDMEEIAASDRVIVLNHGTLFYDGKPDDLLRDRKKIEQASLQIPFAMQLRQALNKYNINLDATTMEGMVEQLCQLRLKK